MTGPNDERIEQLAGAVSQLTEYVQLLINAVDELREEVAWGHRNVGGESQVGSRFRLTSMPIDPTAEDWQLNRLDQSTVNQIRRELTETDMADASQARLF